MIKNNNPKILKCHQLFCDNRPYMKVSLSKNKRKYVHLCFKHYFIFRLKRLIFELFNKANYKYKYKRLKRKVTYMIDGDKEFNK